MGGPVDRRTFLQGAIVSGAVLLGVGAAPFVACLSGRCDVETETPRPATQPTVPPADMAAPKVPKIVAAKCVGCGKCPAVARKTFAMNARTKKAYVKNPTGDPPATISKAIRICPTGAILLK